MVLEGFALIESLVQDLRFALRTLRRSPGFTLVSLLTLALGIGSNVAMWSVADQVLFRDLPYAEPDDLMVVWQHSPKLEFGPLSFPTYRDLEERSRVFESLGLFLPTERNLHGPEGEPERIQGSLVSDNFMEVLGVTPALGRDFEPQDDRPGAARSAMLSHELWQRRFAGQDDILQRDIRLDDQTYRVIGIFPKGLSDEPLGMQALGDVWLPAGIFEDSLPVDDRAKRPNIIAVARSAKLATSVVAQDMARISAELSNEHPQIHKDARIVATPVRQHLIKDDQLIVHLLLAAVGLVLVIAAANLINLQLTRLAKRERELATRWALGARGNRLVRQLLVESSILSLLGGGTGVALALLVLSSFPWLLGEAWTIQGFQPQILAATFLLSLVTGVVIGLVPALQMIRASRRRRFSKMQVRSSLPNRRLRQVLVSLQVALALVTLVGAGLLYGSLQRLERLDPGFATEDRITLKVILPQAAFDQRTTWLSFFDQVQERLATLGGVKGVAVSSYRPLDLAGGGSPAVPGDRALPPVSEMSPCFYQMISPGYFEVLEIPLIAGRRLDARDDDRLSAERVVVISQSLADIYWPDTSPVGKRLAFELKGSPEQPEPQWRRIVGVVADVRNQGLAAPFRSTVYSPYTQIPLWQEGGISPPMVIVLHVEAGRMEDLVAEVRQVFDDMDPDLPMFDVQTISELLAAELEKPRRAATLLMCFATLSLLLVIIGVFGVVSFVVTARTREIGIRMSFGASPQAVAKLFLIQNLLVVSVGVTLGLVTAAALSRLIAGLLFGIPALDILTYGSVALGLLVVASLAALVPAWRASRVRPLEALRYE